MAIPGSHSMHSSTSPVFYQKGTWVFPENSHFQSQRWTFYSILAILWKLNKGGWNIDREMACEKINAYAISRSIFHPPLIFWFLSFLVLTAHSPSEASFLAINSASWMTYTQFDSDIFSTFTGLYFLYIISNNSNNEVFLTSSTVHYWPYSNIWSLVVGNQSLFHVVTMHNSSKFSYELLLLLNHCNIGLQKWHF